MPAGDNSNIVRSVELATSSTAHISDREKQKRIHTWLGEQSADLIGAFPLSTNKVDLNENYAFTNSGELEECTFSAHNKTKPLNGTKTRPMKSSSTFISDEDLSRMQIQSLDLIKKKTKMPLSHKYNRNFQPGMQAKSSMTSDLRHVLAATKIQASWRGFLARCKNPRVIEIRHELRARRTEQYINTLCHEICVIKEKQKAEKKLRDLQTEAIRFMWSQIRQLQNKLDSKSPVFDTCENISSLEQTNSKPDVKENAVNWNNIQENTELKQTVEKLQVQVLQLQEALLSFSDKLIPESDEAVAQTINEELEGEIKVNESSDSEHSDVTTNIKVTSSSSGCQVPVTDDTEILSARDNIPKLSLQNILMALDSPLTEKELWSFCEQAAQALKLLKDVNFNYISPTTVFLRKDGLVSFSEPSTPVDTTYVAPEVTSKSEPTLKSIIFSLAVTMWSAADYSMSEDQAPCLSSSFEALLVKMSHDDCAQRADLNDVLLTCGDHHSVTQSNSLQMCASLFAETTNIKRGKRRQISSVNLAELVTKDIQKTRSNFVSNVVPQLNKISFTLKPVSQRKLAPLPESNKTPHDKITEEIHIGIKLKSIPPPKIYSVKNLFSDNPELIQTLNILPGQRRRNIFAIKHTQKQSPGRDSLSATRSGWPSPPHGLKCEVKNCSSSRRSSPADYSCLSDENNCTLVLRWHPSYVYDKHGNKSKCGSIVGYRIYVNGQPKGMVTGAKCRALLDGLKKTIEYRIYVCAVSALGESQPSNIVVANVADEETAPFPPRVAKKEKCTPLLLAKDSTFHGPENTKVNSGGVANDDDVVDRVLRRYGIKKPDSPTVMSNENESKPRQIIGNRVLNSYNQDGKKLSEKNAQPHLTSLDNYSTASSCSGDDHITPRTKALLEQLKDDLMS